MSRVIAIGEQYEIVGYKAVGVELVAVTSPAGLEEVLYRETRDPGLGLVLITEKLAAETQRVVASFRKKTRIPILVVPSHLGSTGVALSETASLIKKIAGVDILRGAG